MHAIHERARRDGVRRSSLSVDADNLCEALRLPRLDHEPADGKGRIRPRAESTALVLDGVLRLVELDDVALLNRIFCSASRHLLPAGEELEVHREVEELLALGVYDSSRFLVRLDRQALLVPADGLRLLGAT